MKNFGLPDLANVRLFYMNVVMNNLALEGLELPPQSDDIIMHRTKI
jgi:hypothetical protein